MGGLLMKRGRTIAGLMLALLVIQFAATVGLWIGPFFLGNDPADPALDAIAIIVLVLLVLSIIVMIWAQQFIDTERQKEATRKHGGLLRSRFSWRYWQEY